ncbi:MAG: hypothetical protein ACI9WU_000862 [Myxococcota bacterium]|jgi:hypothetical protein
MAAPCADRGSHCRRLSLDVVSLRWPREHRSDTGPAQSGSALRDLDVAPVSPAPPRDGDCGWLGSPVSPPARWWGTSWPQRGRPDDERLALNHLHRDNGRAHCVPGRQRRNAPDRAGGQQRSGRADRPAGQLRHQHGDRDSHDGAPLNDGEWHHVVATRSAWDYRVYLDGIANASAYWNTGAVTLNRVRDRGGHAGG